MSGTIGLDAGPEPMAARASVFAAYLDVQYDGMGLHAISADLAASASGDEEVRVTASATAFLPDLRPLGFTVDSRAELAGVAHVLTNNENVPFGWTVASRWDGIDIPH